MNTTERIRNKNIHQFRQRERVVFDTIPGMRELLQAESEDEFTALQAMYPDASFALMTASNLFCKDRELNDIHLRAYQAILDGTPIAHVRYRYDYDLEAYLERHLWDD